MTGPGSGRGRKTRAPPHDGGPGAAADGGLARHGAAAVLALGALVAVAYLPVTGAGFVWDDFIIVTSKAVGEGWSGLRGLWLAPGATYMPGNTDEDHYWPLLYTTFWLEHKLWGFAPLGYHLVNVALHLVNTLLVWRLLRRLAAPGAWLAAAVFAVHPVHVEAVAWVIARKDLLSAALYLTAALVWLGFVEKPRPGRYVLALALYVAAMLSKSIAVTLPAALLIVHWWKEGRVSGACLLRLAPFFAVGLGIALAEMAFVASRKIVSYDYTIVERMLMAAHALWFYAGKLVWPVDLSPIYPPLDVGIGDPASWGYVAATGAVAVLAWRFRRRLGRGPAAGALCFAVTLSPVLGFVDQSWMQFTVVADRYQYLASIGLTAVLIAGAVRIASLARAPDSIRAPGPAGAAGAGGMAGRDARRIAAALAALALAVLAAVTWRQTGVYRDEVAFFRHVLAINPGEPVAHLHLGKALSELDRAEPASGARRAGPETGSASTPEGAAGRSGPAGTATSRASTSSSTTPADPPPPRADHLAEAERHYRRALEIDPDFTNARQNLAELFRQQHRYEEAIGMYREVLAAEPDSPLAHAGLGVALYSLQRHEEAVASMERAVSLRRDWPAAPVLLVLMGRASLALDRRDAAAEHFERALALDRRSPEALDLLAEVRLGQGRHEEALALWRALVELAPGNTRAHTNAGVALYRLGRIEEALRSFERALAIDPLLPSARANRAAARERLARE